MIPLTVISIKVDEKTVKHAARQQLYLDRQEYELFGISYSPASIQEEQHTPLTYRRPKMQNYTFSPIGFNVVVGHFWSHCSKHIFANPRLAFLDAVSDKKPATNHNRA